MNNLQEYTATAIAIIGAFGGWGAIRYFLNLRAERHKIELENKKNELDIMRGLYEQLDKKVKELSAKVDELYKQVRTLEMEKISLIQKNSMLEVEVEKAKRNECVRPDDECLRRMPDRDYCRLKRLAQGKYDRYHKENGGDGDAAAATDTAKKEKEDEGDGDDDGEEEEHH